MKTFFVLCLVVAIVVAKDSYNTDHDDLDIDAILDNPETLDSYVGCFLDRIPCIEELKGFREDFPDAIDTACVKCNSRQKYLLKTYLKGLKEKRPEELEAHKKKYDPEGTKFAALEKVFAED